MELSKAIKRGAFQMNQSKMNPNFEEAARRLLFQDRIERYLVLEKVVGDLS